MSQFGGTAHFNDRVTAHARKDLPLLQANMTVATNRL